MNEPVALLDAVLGIIGGLLAAWFAWRLQAKDRAHDATALDFKEWKKKMEDTVEQIKDHAQKQDLDAKDLVPRSELTATVGKVYDEIKGLRADLQDELKDLNTLVLNAITHRGGGS